MYQATFQASFSLSEPGLPSGMFKWMNEAAVYTRAMPAPQLYDPSPQSAGKTI